jgi:hypothetical protein
MYDKTESLAAMYHLLKQGFKDITLKIQKDNTLLLGCNGSVVPDIEIDSIRDWTTEDWGITYEFQYWWIFD